jgi:hypothetical protein
MSDLAEYLEHLAQINESIDITEQQIHLLQTRLDQDRSQGLGLTLMAERLALSTESRKLLLLRRLQILHKIECTSVHLF